LTGKSRGLQTDSLEESVEVIDDALMEAVKLRLALAAEPFVAVHRGKQAGGERRVDSLEELQEGEADRIAVRQEPVTTGARCRMVILRYS